MRDFYQGVDRGGSMATRYIDHIKLNMAKGRNWKRAEKCLYLQQDNGTGEKEDCF